MKDYARFSRQAEEICPKRVFTSLMLRYAYGVDASCYSYVPEVVVKAYNEQEVIKLISLAHQCNTPLTFRAAGTSLSGQASSDSVLVIVNDGFKDVSVLEDGKALRCECGVIGSDANEALVSYGTKIGPDPATITSALIGGILNNNSSGMCCGVAQNSYQTVRSLRVVLPDGFVLDTSSQASIEAFLLEKKELVQGIMEMRAEIMKDQELLDLIKRKFKIKNTTGYSINALVDFEDPIDIINHLFVGSEGTLGFVSEIVYDCVEDIPYKGCGLFFYGDLQEAGKAVVRLAQMSRERVVAAEMMDYRSLKCVQKLESVPDFVRGVPEGTCCLLIQSESNNEQQLYQNLDFIRDELSDLQTIMPSRFSTDPEEFASWWVIRKGLLPIAAGGRKNGTTVITEDVCFKIEDFIHGIELLSELFDKYDFSDSGVIFGHALSGNLHFMITPDLSDPREQENFTMLVKEMAERVSAMEGSIKAEHGTGRMVAPFVEMEWGKKAYAINRRIKELFDPGRLINPDVIITDDPDIYKKNLKAQAPIDPLFTMCMECGFCEKHCPSRNLTLTPRQRIALLREEQRALMQGDEEMAREISKGYQYYGNETCAACAMCSTLCPLGINTAEIALSMRRVAKHPDKLIHKAYSNFATTLKMAKAGTTLGGAAQTVLSKKGVANISRAIHKGVHMFPYAPTTLPKANHYKLVDHLYACADKEEQFGDILHKEQLDPSSSIVYFSACANRAFNMKQDYPDKRSLQQVIESLCNKARINVIYPPKIEGLCCGLMFEDFRETEAEVLADLAQSLLEASDGGRLPIMVDHSSCYGHVVHRLLSHMHGEVDETLSASRLRADEIESLKNLHILDISEFIYEILIERLVIQPQDISVIVHKPCKARVTGKDHYIEQLARLCATKVTNIKSFACDGFAGYKGFFTPELNQCATKDLSKEVAACGASLGVSSSSTCEVGLGDNSNIPFVNIAYLVDACSRSR